MTLLKRELIERLSDEVGISKSQAKKNLDSLISIITDSLLDAQKVEIRGLGTFEVFNQKGMELKDLKTGKNKKVADYKIVKFRTSQVLKKKLNL